ncbi:MAG: hypothetical protein ABIU77_23040 [Ferruginibacter sp.]|jgi:chromate transport protein ChrA
MKIAKSTKRDFFNFIQCILITYFVTLSLSTIIFGESFSGWLYFLVVGIPVAFIPCGIGYFLYLVFIMALMKFLKYKVLKQILLLVCTMILILIIVNTWEKLQSHTFPDFIGEPNYYLNFTIIGILQINFLKFKSLILTQAPLGQENYLQK